MHVGTDHNPPSLATLVAGLGDLGWFDGPPAQVMQQLIGDGKLVDGRMKQVQGEYDGQRIQLIWRNLDGKDQAAEQAQEFVRERVDLIVAFEDKSIAAAQNATADPANRIPVVFLHPSDPVRDGLVDSLAHPGGNLTGAFGARDPVVKQLEIYRQILPDTAAPAPAHARRSDRRRRDAAAPGQGARCRRPSSGSSWSNARHPTTPVSRPPSSRSARARSTARSSCRPAFGSTSPKKILALAAAANLPVQAHRREWVDPQQNDHGALFSLGVDLAPVGAAAAPFVDSILKGAKPADLPAQEVPKVEFALSLKRAAELGIKVPDDVITQADVVYP